ncbi:hypothetical protein GGS24DRAFT_469750 [Hypoxylon argillaceum]|nr:hypothetical protein GGS24DRAFT_469750 [Hypoxylon argillaceum]KAI1154057.1 hypothetical protein F4825DRAFT_412896 [Nemania diffusa]
MSRVASLLAPSHFAVTKKSFLSSPCAVPSYHLFLLHKTTVRNYCVFLSRSSPSARSNNRSTPSTLPALPHHQRRALTMSEKLIPKDPSAVQVIRNVTPNVVTVSVPFLRFEKIPIGGRATIVKLTSGALAVFSPVALTDEVKAKITELGGNVGYLIAGDLEHHIFLTTWKTEYPAAKLVGPKGLPERRKTMTDPLIGKEEFDFLYDATNAHSAAISDEFAADFEVELVDAHPNKEIALFYKPDKVLIEADLMFNLPPTEQYSKVPEAEKKGGGLLKKIFYALNTTVGPAKGHKRLLWYAVSSGGKDRPGFNESIKRIYGWDFVTLIPCHGDTIEGTGKETFGKIFDWHINGKK